MFSSCGRPAAQGFDITNRRFNDCLFENQYGLEATDENKQKIYEKDAYNAWALGQDSTETFFDADETEDHADPHQYSELREVNESHEDDSEAHQVGGKTMRTPINSASSARF